MSSEQPVAAPPESTASMFRAMVGIGAICGLLIVSVFVATRPRIERIQSEALQRAILQVLPGARSSAAFRSTEAGGFERLADAEASRGEELVYAGYDAEGQLVGLAVEARTMGYQDVIGLLYGYAPDQDAIIGIRVLESRETPGLGDRIESDPAFLANFERLDVTLDTAGASLAHPIEAVGHGKKQHPWQVDGITGATISSTAVARALDESASRWVPRIRRDPDALREDASR